MLVFSNGFVPTPSKKPPRFDLRHRKKKKPVNQAPKLPKPPKLSSEKGFDPLFESNPDSGLSEFLNDNYLLTREFSKEGASGLDVLMDSISTGSEDDEASNTTSINDAIDGANPYEKKVVSKPEKGSKKKPEPNTPIKLTFESKDWVFTQATAVASVNLTEKGEITTDTIQYVNNNGNSWSSETLRKYYKTFIGAMNLKDHEQPSEGGTIYGIIIDAVLRKIKTPTSGFIYYVDCLIATNRNVDEDWAKSIEKGKVKYLSVGCFTDFLQCSKCGDVHLADDTGYCPHKPEVGMTYRNKDGYKSKVSDMIVDYDNQGRVEFVELSYLSVDPAFTGAVQGHKLEVKFGEKVEVVVPYKYLKKPAFQEFSKDIKKQIVRTK